MASLSVLANDSMAAGTATLGVAAAPAHGKVTVQGTTLQYTPDAGFYGTDQFTYRVDLGTAYSTATVKLTVEAEIELSGSITPPPNSLTEVTAQVGDQQYKTNADASGTYKLSVKTAQPTAFITLTARESGARAAYVYSSLVGEASSLTALAAMPKIGAEHWPALKLDVLTTARRGLLEQRGVQVKTTSELKDALARQDPSDLLDIATLLGHVYEDPAALPAGTATTADLAASASALAAVQRQWETRGGSIHDSVRIEKMLDQMMVQAPPVVAAQGTRLVSLNQGANTVSIPDGSLFDLRPDGSAMGHVWDYAGSTAIAGSWTRNGNILSIALASPLVMEGRFRVRTLQYRQIRGVDLQPSRQLMMRWETDCGVQTSYYCPPPGFSAWVPAVSFDVERDRQALRFEDFTSTTRWAGLLVDKDARSAECLCMVTDLTFDGTPNAGGLSGQLVSGQWRLTGSAHAYRYTRLGAGPEEGMEYWLAEYEQGGITTRARLLLVAKGSAIAPLDLVAAARRWGSQQQRANGSADPSGRRTYLYPTILHKDGRRTYDFGGGEVDRGDRWAVSSDSRTIQHIRPSDGAVFILYSLVRPVSGGYLAMSDGGGLVRIRDLGAAD